MAFDEAQYSTAKQNITDTAVDGDSIVVSTTAFDPNTGERLPDVQDKVSVSDIRNRISGYQDYINNAQAFLDDAVNKVLPTAATLEKSKLLR